MDSARHDQTSAEHAIHAKHYVRLAGMAALSFFAMFILMYAMVDRASSIYPNLNQAYMALLMAAPMVLIELALMGKMYPDKRMNLIIAGASAVVGLAAFFAIREQAAIGDDEFLRSMIPHHSGAILMCEQAPIQDADIQALCQRIIASQREEIAEMKGLLNR